MGAISPRENGGLPLPPFRIFGNLYYVGNRDVCAYLLDTEAGPVMIDTGYPTDAAGYIETVRRAGFDPGRTAAILHTHGHYDHFGGTEALVRLSGARTYLGAGDARMFQEQPELALIPAELAGRVRPFVPDCLLRDGDRLTFGSMSIQVLETPGHSAGTCSFFFPLEEAGRRWRASLIGGIGFNTLTPDFQRQYGYRGRTALRRSLERLWGEPVDIVLANHFGQMGFRDRAERFFASGDRSVFVDGGAWRRSIAALLDRLERTEPTEAAEPDKTGGGL